jgi:hypothetical protein
MKKILNLLLIVSCIFALASCKQDDPVVELTLDKTAVGLIAGATTPVNIVTGNGNYTVTSSASDIATATVSGTVITVTGNKAGTATITLKDKDSKSISISVVVSPTSSEFVWDTNSVTLDQATAYANSYSLTVYSNSIAVTNITTKQQYVLSWTGDLTVGDKTNGKLQIVNAGVSATAITLSSISVVTANTTTNNYYLTFKNDTKSGLIYFTK